MEFCTADTSSWPRVLVFVLLLSLMLISIVSDIGGIVVDVVRKST